MASNHNCGHNINDFWNFHVCIVTAIAAIISNILVLFSLSHKTSNDCLKTSNDKHHFRTEDWWTGTCWWT